MFNAYKNSLRGPNLQNKWTPQNITGDMKKKPVFIMNEFILLLK